MSGRLVTITIGIPAHNEEKNIRRLLTRLLQQKEDGFIMQKIIVVDDASTDRTANRAQSIRDARIKLLHNQTRRGQSYSQNLIFEQATSDIVVLLEADTLPIGDTYIQKLIVPLVNGRSTGLVQGNPIAQQSQTTIGRVVQKQAEVYCLRVLRQLNPAHFVSSGRGGRAFSRALYKSLRWPQHVLEDKYATLWCQKHDFLIVFQKSATCLFRPEQTLNDFIRARRKVINGYRSLLRYFDRDAIDAMYTCSRREMVFMATQFAVTQPLYFFLYALMKTYAEMFVPPSKFSDFWHINHSTKNLLKVTTS